MNLFLGEPADLPVCWQPRGDRRGQSRRGRAQLPSNQDRPAATATVICSSEADLPTSLQVYGSSGRIMIDDFFIRPSEMLVYRGRPHDVAPEVLVTQWPGGGYTFQAQEVMRCSASW